METANTLRENFNDIIFENRNKQYGAFAIRKYYSDSVTLAFFIALTAITALFATPIVLQLLNVKDVVTKVPETPPLDDLKIYKIELPKTPPAGGNDMKTPNKNLAPVVSNKKDSVAPEKDPIVITTVEPGKGKDTLGIAGLTGGPGKNPDKGKDSIQTPERTELIVARMPRFPGGDEALVKYLSSHITYPPNALSTGISGTVHLTFVIDKQGKVTDVAILRPIAGGCTEEAIKVVKSMPAWEPGQNESGKNVRVQYNLPISFRLK